MLATGGYWNVFYLSTNAEGSNTTAIWRAHRRAPFFGNPCFTQIHPTCIPLSSEHQSKLTLMSESLRNDGRVWVPKKKGDMRAPNRISRKTSAIIIWSDRYPSFGNLVPRTSPHAPPRKCAMKDAASVRGGQGVYLDFADAIQPPRAKPFAKNTATSSTFMKRSRMRMLTKFRCESIPRSITRWAGCGWITS